MRGIYWVWLDEAYVLEAVGLPEDTPVVTELYDPLEHSQDDP
ncbi:hypothetical protein [Candidatus Korarchaeum cryptofilum]|jgi:hypothetical protein|nr:hypothetical protein [Candidatus Korarchaeum cryptofilum]